MPLPGTLVSSRCDFAKPLHELSVHSGDVTIVISFCAVHSLYLWPNSAIPNSILNIYLVKIRNASLVVCVCSH